MKEYSFEPHWGDEDQAKYKIVYDHRSKDIEIALNCICQSGDIFFKSKDDCNKCVEEIGAETIKKYYFRLKD